MRGKHAGRVHKLTRILAVAAVMLMAVLLVGGVWWLLDSGLWRTPSAGGEDVHSEPTFTLSTQNATKDTTTQPLISFTTTTTEGTWVWEETLTQPATTYSSVLILPDGSPIETEPTDNTADDWMEEVAGDSTTSTEESTTVQATTTKEPTTTKPTTKPTTTTTKKTTTTTTTQPPRTELALVEKGRSGYSLQAVGEAVPLAKQFAADIATAFGVQLPVAETVRGPRIRLVLGDGQCGKHGYTFTVQGDDLLVRASDAEAMGYALATLKTTYIAPQKASGSLVLPLSGLPDRRGDTPFTITEALDLGLNITLQHQEIFTFAPVTVEDYNLRVAQGACTDGRFVYFIMRVSKDVAAVVVRTDLDGSNPQMSQPMDFGHANDLTYDSKRHRLILVHGSSTTNTAGGNDNGRRLSFLDPDTLELLYTQADILPKRYEAGAFAYVEATDSILVTRGGSAFRELSIDDDYQVTPIRNPGRKSRRTEGSTDYTAQGAGTDGRYVYFPMSGSEDNVVVVYTVEGTFVRTIHIPTAMESESLFFHKGKMYMIYHSGGAVVGEVTFQATYITAEEPESKE